MDLVQNQYWQISSGMMVLSLRISFQAVYLQKRKDKGKKTLQLTDSDTCVSLLNRKNKIKDTEPKSCPCKL